MQTISVTPEQPLVDQTNPGSDMKIRRFTLSPKFLRRFEGKQPKWPASGLGYFTFKRTYAREKEDGTTEEFWEMCKRVVEGCFTHQKIHCRHLRTPWNDAKAQRSAQDMFLRMWEFKWSPPGRGLWMMGTDYVMDRGSACLNNCFSGDTRAWVVGEQGALSLVSLRDLAEHSKGELPITVLTSQGPSRAVARSFGVQSLQKVSFAPVGLRSNFRLEYDVTSNHRWILSDGSHTTSLKVGDRVRINPESLDATPGNEADLHAGFVHGMVFGDGTRHTYYPERHHIRLCGEKDKANLESLERSEYHFSTNYPPTYNGDPLVSFKLPEGVSWKHLPAEDSSLAYQRGFLLGWLAADGSKKSSGSVVLCTQNAEAASWLTERAPLLGFCAVGFNYDPVMETNYGPRSSPMARVTLVEKAVEYVVKSILDEGREEEVFCVTERQNAQFMLEGGLVTGNCAFVTTENINHDFAEPFCFLMDMSMLGVGVGGDTRGAGKVRIQRPETTDEVLDINTLVADEDGDSREGWVALVRLILDSFVGKNRLPLNIDYSCIRGRGEPIKGFGGTASGPGPLEALVQHIIDTLMPEPGQDSYFITSTHIVDVFNFIGKCVVAGGVRRSAEIMFGDPSDQDFLLLKQDMEALNDRRWVSNNSVFGEVGMDYSRIAELVATNGEPGIVWLDNLRGWGRMGDPRNDKDELVMGMNPCAEQPLEDHELCCLVETYPAHHDSLEDYIKTLKMAYLYAKTVTLIPTHNPKTNAVMMRNRRIGCSMSGIVQAMQRFGRRQFFDWCEEGYQAIQHFDRTYSRWFCVPRSIKTTSVKPSGTVSLLAGATPGIHYPHSEHYIRRIRVSNTSPLVQACINAGYHVEPDNYADDTAVVSFPVKEENFDRGESQVSVWEQFSNVAAVQRHWADNSVSVTVKFHEAEAEDILRCLEIYETSLKSVSFLKHSGHGYVQAPYEAIDEETYLEMTKHLKPLDLSGAQHEVTDRFCSGDKCTLPWAETEA